MSTTTIRFEEIKHREVRRFFCPMCHKRGQLATTFSNTVNPFNRDPESGLPRTRAQIMRKLAAEGRTWSPLRMHPGCQAALPVFLAARMEERYGVLVSRASDEGDYVVVGHHRDSRRMVAAILREQRRWGERSYASDLESFAYMLARVFAVVTQADDGWGWSMEWVPEGTPGALPVTRWIAS